MTKAGRLIVVRGWDAMSVLERLRSSLGPELFARASLGSGPAELVLAATDPAHLAEQGAYLLRSGLAPASRAAREKRGIYYNPSPAPEAVLAFLFTGQGSQYRGMLCDLLASSAAAREQFEALDDALQRIPGAPTDLFRSWARGEPLADAEHFAVQGLVLAADLILNAALQEQGVTPGHVTGHSYGDYAALVVAGSWSLDDALQATWIRAEALRQCGITGGMVALETTREPAERLVEAVPGCYIANRNGHQQTVVAVGGPTGVRALESEASRRRIHARVLRVPGPFHSPWMEPVVERFRDKMVGRRLRPPRIPFLSSVTGQYESNPDRLWNALIRQLTVPIDFPAQLKRLQTAGVRSLVEVGPRAALTSLIHREAPDLRVVASDAPQVPSHVSLLRVRAALRGRSPGR